MTTPLETKIERAGEAIARPVSWAKIIAEAALAVFFAGGLGMAYVMKIVTRPDIPGILSEHDARAGHANAEEVRAIREQLIQVQAQLDLILRHWGIQPPPVAAPSPPPPAIGPINDRVPRRKVRHGKPPETGSLLAAPAEDVQARAWESRYGGEGQ